MLYFQLGMGGWRMGDGAVQNSQERNVQPTPRDLQLVCLIIIDLE